MNLDPLQLRYPVSRTHMAWLFSVDRLLQNWPVAHFWTFTFDKVLCTWHYPMRWHDFMLAVEKQYGKNVIKGLRVIEPHPGEYSHGYHFHAIIAGSLLNINWINKVKSRFDIGRVQIDKDPVTIGTGLYLAKYLSKESEQLPGGMRKWGSIGGWDYTRVRDVEVQSTFHRNVATCQQMCKTRQLTMDVIHTIMLHSDRYGSIENWPINFVSYGQSDNCLAPLKLPTPDPADMRTKEQHMMRQAAIWKEKARIRGLRRVERTRIELAEERGARRRRKNFLENAPGDAPGHPGESPVKNSYYLLDTSDYNWNTLSLKKAGIPPAIK